MRTLRQTLADLGITQDEAARLLETSRESINRRADADLLDSLQGRMALLAAGYLQIDPETRELVEADTDPSEVARLREKLTRAGQLATAIASLLEQKDVEFPPPSENGQKFPPSDLTAVFTGIRMPPMTDLEITRSAQDKSPIPARARMDLVLPADLVQRLDEVARQYNTSRSEVVRQVLVRALEVA